MSATYRWVDLVITGRLYFPALLCNVIFSNIYFLSFKYHFVSVICRPSLLIFYTNTKNYSTMFWLCYRHLPSVDNGFRAIGCSRPIFQNFESNDKWHWINIDIDFGVLWPSLFPYKRSEGTKMDVSVGCMWRIYIYLILNIGFFYYYYYY